MWLCNVHFPCLHDFVRNVVVHFPDFPSSGADLSPWKQIYWNDLLHDLTFLHSWVPDTFARVVCNNMWSLLELIGKTCIVALTRPVCNPRSAMQWHKLHVN